MQRQNALRVDATIRTPAVNKPITPRAERIVVMRTRALLAAVSHQRADLLSQLLSHLGHKTFAQTLATLPSRDQVAALRMLSAERRAAVFRELSQPQREIWHKASLLEQQAQRSLFARCKQFLRVPFFAAITTATKAKAA